MIKEEEKEREKGGGWAEKAKEIVSKTSNAVVIVGIPIQILWDEQ